MKRAKKFLVTAGVMAGLLSCNMVSLAAESGNGSKETLNPDAVIIREDIPLEEAMKDATFNSKRNQSRKSTVLETQDVYWKVWGDYSETTGKDGTPGVIPIGYSEHRNGNVVLDTYHYTRTYLGSIVKRGDSGRCWGTGRVKAVGTFCDNDVWAAHQHIVKYGTED